MERRQLEPIQIREAAREAVVPQRQRAHALRRLYAVVLCAVFMGRQDTSTGLRSADHGIDEGNSGFIWLRISEKMRRGWAFRRIVRLPLTARSFHGHASLLPQLGELGCRQGLPRRPGGARGGA